MWWSDWLIGGVKNWQFLVIELSINLDISPGCDELEHAECCHGSDELGFWLADCLDVPVLINADHGGNHTQHGDNETTIEAMPIMLSAESDTDQKGTAKKDRHQHFCRGACCVEAFPFDKSGEA